MPVARSLSLLFFRPNMSDNGFIPSLDCALSSTASVLTSEAVDLFSLRPRRNLLNTPPRGESLAAAGGSILMPERASS